MATKLTKVVVLVSALSGVFGSKLSPRLSTCCEEISNTYPSVTFFPKDTPGNYTRSTSSYYSGQENDLKPTCVFRPQTTSDVSGVVDMLHRRTVNKLRECPFAIRGGGHTPYAGAANVDGGLTIDLSDLNQVTVSKDKQVTSVGGGARWENVYSVLGEVGLAITGGRVDPVGVGGLTTGGGFSFFSAQQGFVCDNVLNYELIVANGSVLNVNTTSNPDLTIALRGGSNNFGIVTRFDFSTFPQGGLWGGDIIYPFEETYAETVKAFTDLGGDKNYDPSAAMYPLFVYINGSTVVSTNLIYTQPKAYPEVFRAFTDIQPQYSNTLRFGNLTNFTNIPTVNAQVSRRNAYMTTTWLNDLETSRFAAQVWNQSAIKLNNITGLSYALDFQMVPPAISNKSAARGGNSLGIDPSKGTIVIALLQASWENANDDECVRGALGDTIGAFESRAKTRGRYVEFKYLNYADKGQDVMRGYGEESLERLQRVSKMYDPAGLFQGGNSGDFKVFPKGPGEYSDG